MKAGPKGPWGAHCNCKTVQLSVRHIYIYIPILSIKRVLVFVCASVIHKSGRAKLASTIPCGKRVSRVVVRGVGSHST